MPHPRAPAAVLPMLLLVGACMGGAPPRPEPHGIPTLGARHVLPSTALGEERILWVWTPPGYTRSRPGLPVLYLLDADVHFRHATALAHFLAYFLRAPEMIVVGVLHTDRTAELAPARPEESGTASSGARGDRFLRFLTDEARPFVDSTYNTAPFTILVGHSLGGLLAVHAAFTQPRAFSAYVAMSPSLDWADSLVLREVRDVIERRGALPRILHLALAENERPGITAATRSLTTTLRASAPSGLRWDLVEVPGENHLTVALPALHAAARWLFADWTTPMGASNRVVSERSLAPFDEAFDQLTARYGHEVLPSELAFSMVGDRLYRAEAFELAIELFARRVALYPTSPEAHDELARGYEAAGRLEEAVASCDRAIALAREQQHPSLEAIRGRLERLRAAQDASR